MSGCTWFNFNEIVTETTDFIDFIYNKIYFTKGTIEIVKMFFFSAFFNVNLIWVFKIFQFESFFYWNIFIIKLLLMNRPFILDHFIKIIYC